MQVNDLFDESRIRWVIKRQYRHHKRSLPGNNGITWVDVYFNQERYIKLVQNGLESCISESRHCVKRGIFQASDTSGYVYIPNVEDRLMQLVFCKFFEDQNIFSQPLYRLRVVTGENAFVHYVNSYRCRYGALVLHVDIVHYFASLSHVKIIAFLKEYIGSELANSVVRILDLQTGMFGIPIGYPLSTWLASRFLYQVDTYFADTPIVRLMDDYFVFDTYEHRLWYEIYPVLVMRIQEYGLSVNTKKSRIIHGISNIHSLLLR